MSLTCFFSNSQSVVALADWRKYTMNPDGTMESFSDDGYKLFQISPDFIVSVIGEVSSLVKVFVKKLQEEKLDYRQGIEALEKFYETFREPLSKHKCCLTFGGIADGTPHLMTSSTIGFKIRVYKGNETFILAGPPDYDPVAWLSPIFENENHDLQSLTEMAKNLIEHTSKRSAFVSPSYDLFTLGGDRS